MNERFWQCNLQENGVNLRHIMTRSANNNQTVNGISLKKEENLSKLLEFFFNILVTLLRFKIRLQQNQRNNKNEKQVTNVVEFANGVSEESLEKMQNIHADFNGTIMQFQWYAISDI